MKKLIVSTLILSTLYTGQAQAGVWRECREVFGMLWGDRYDDMSTKLMGRGILLFSAGLGGTLTWIIGSMVHDHIVATGIANSITPAERDALRARQIGPGEQPMVEVQGDRYFGRSGYLFRLRPNGEIENVGKGEVSALYAYENSVVARAPDGEVSIYVPDSEHWFGFDLHGAEITSFEDRLYVRTVDNKYWALTGTHGALHVHTRDDGYWMTTFDASGNPTMTYYPDVKYFLRDSQNADVAFMPARRP